MDEIDRALLANERLLWTGAPATGLRLRKSDVGTIPFSLLWTGFAIFWESLALASKAPWFFKLWGIPFVLIGLHLVAGRFFTDARRRARTRYAITDQRLLISDGNEVTSVPRSKLWEIHTERHRDGRSTITFGPTSTPKGQPPSPSFEFIDDDKTVMGILQPALPAYR